MPSKSYVTGGSIQRLYSKSRALFKVKGSIQRQRLYSKALFKGSIQRLYSKALYSKALFKGSIQRLYSKALFKGSACGAGSIEAGLLSAPCRLD
jgi:hypothetical protein